MQPCCLNRYDLTFSSMTKVPLYTEGFNRTAEWLDPGLRPIVQIPTAAPW